MALPVVTHELLYLILRWDKGVMQISDLPSNTRQYLELHLICPVLPALPSPHIFESPRTPMSSRLTHLRGIIGFTVELVAISYILLRGNMVFDVNRCTCKFGLRDWWSPEGSGMRAMRRAHHLHRSVCPRSCYVRALSMQTQTGPGSSVWNRPIGTREVPATEDRNMGMPRFIAAQIQREKIGWPMGPGPPLLVTTSVIMHTAGTYALLFCQPGGLELGMFASSYAVRMFGITGGFHRYFAHNSYKTSRPFQALLLASPAPSHAINLIFTLLPTPSSYWH